jgi:molybdopterin-guanine dinucleotide biosynthesis protein A
LLTQIAQLEGFILAGGASSRMGTDKSQLLLENQTFVERIANTLLTITNSVRLVGRHENQENSKLALVPDVYRQWGALGGLHAAVAACRREWAIVVACDLPFVTAELFNRLASLRADHDAVVPIQSDGRLQPLCALYRAETCSRWATELIEAGRRRPLDLIESVNTRRVEFAEIANLAQAERFFVNINTPEDYYGVLRGPREG